ncbi:MAG: hypothetical protein ACOYOK_01290 [Pseudobdellovibrionaceae bacterium]
MKTCKFLLPLTFTFVGSLSHGFLGIPGTPSIPGIDPLDTIRVIERQQRCDQIRDDANKHIQYYNQVISYTNNNLSTTQQRLTSNESNKSQQQQEFEKLNQMLNQQNENLDLLNSLNQYGSEIEVLLRKLLKSKQVLTTENIWQKLANKTTNPTLQQKLQQLQNTHFEFEVKDLLLHGYHFNDYSKTLLKSLLQQKNNLQQMLINKEQNIQDLIAGSQNLNAQIQGLIQEIRQATEEKNKQEERKSCNF